MSISLSLCIYIYVHIYIYMYVYVYVCIDFHGNQSCKVLECIVSNRMSLRADAATSAASKSWYNTTLRRVRTLGKAYTDRRCLLNAVHVKCILPSCKLGRIRATGVPPAMTTAQSSLKHTSRWCKGRASSCHPRRCSLLPQMCGTCALRSVGSGGSWASAQLAASILSSSVEHA